MLAVLLVFGAVHAVNVPSAFAEDLPPRESTEEKHPNMDSRLADMYARTVPADNEGVPNSAQQDQERVQVIIQLVDSNTPIPENLGISVEITYEDLVQATVPVRNLDAIASHDSVLMIKLPSRPHHASHITSEGADVIWADIANIAGYTGKGVKVAVIDGGFDIYEHEIASNIAGYKSYLHPHNNIAGNSTDDTRHGTASAEIVVDVAPNVELYLYNFGTSVEFFNLVDYIIQRGDIDIITLSWSWPGSGPGDGTGVFAQKVQEARDSGILWINSAGNYAERHWQGQFSDTDADNWHNFHGADETINISVYEGDTLRVALSWDDWESTSQDYELCLDEFIFGNLREIICSENPQGSGYEPYESITYEVPHDTTLYVSIKKYSATRDVNLQLFSFNHNLDQYTVAKSSIGTPADSRGALSVGASNWTDDTLEEYSSRGPTLDGRIKPDISAPTGVMTTSYQPLTYTGTSAAAPHVAGAAALVMEKYPDATADHVQKILESTTYNRHAKSNDDGTGRLDIRMLIGTDVLALDSGTGCDPCFYPDTVRVMPGQSITWVNTDTVGIRLGGNSTEGTFDSGMLDRGQTYSRNFGTNGTFAYYDILHPWATGTIIVDSGTTASDRMDMLEAKLSDLEDKIAATAQDGARVTNLENRTSTIETNMASLTDMLNSLKATVEALIDRVEQIASSIGSPQPPVPEPDPEPEPLLSGTVYRDTNGNGQRDAGEQGVANITVLIVDLSDFTKVLRDTTDSSGMYEFIDLETGSYLVQVEGIVGSPGFAYLTITDVIVHDLGVV